MNKTTSVLLSILLTGLIVGFGSYYLTSQVAQTEREELESQINQLESQVEQIQGEDQESTNDDEGDTESSNLRTYTDIDEGLSFEYPKSWGRVTKNENPAIDVRHAENITYLFSDFPGDDDFSGYNKLELISKNDYISSNDSAQRAYNFLSSVYSNQTIEGSDLSVTEANLFGANIARKSDMKYISSDSGEIRGVYFFMRDGNGFGPDLSLNTALLNDEDELLGITLYLWSDNQEELEDDLETAAESGETSDYQAWDKKMDYFMNNQAATVFNKEVSQLKELVGSLNY